MKIITLTTFFTLFAFPSFCGDILILNNQLVFMGKVKRIKDCSVVFQVDREKYIVPTSDIFSIQFENTSDKVYTDYMKLLEDPREKCMKARFDAEYYHGKKGRHFFLGLLFGPFAMISTAFSNPIPEDGNKTRQMSKNTELFNDPTYLKCYKRTVKIQFYKAECRGLYLWLIIPALLVAF